MQQPPIGAAILRSLFGTLLFVLIGNGTQAQTRTIINTEKAAPEAGKGWHASLNARGSFAKGNIDLVDINADGMIGLRREKDWFRLLGGSTYFEQNSAKSIDNQYLQFRYSHFFSKESEWQNYNFLQYQSNFTLILKERAIAGSGFRRSFSLGDSGSFDLGGGAMWEYESLDRGQLEEGESAIVRNWRFTSVFVVRQKLGKSVTLLNTAYFQPRMTDLRDIRALEELSLLTELTEHFQFDVTFYWRWDSKPPEAVVTSDLGLDVGVLLEF